MFGVNSQSARALAGPMTSISAANKAHFFTIAVPPGPVVHTSHTRATLCFRPTTVQAKYPWGPGELNETIETIGFDETVTTRGRARLFPRRAAPTHALYVYRSYEGAQSPSAAQAYRRGACAKGTRRHWH